MLFSTSLPIDIIEINYGWRRFTCHIPKLRFRPHPIAGGSGIAQPGTQTPFNCGVGVYQVNRFPTKPSLQKLPSSFPHSLVGIPSTLMVLQSKSWMRLWRSISPRDKKNNLNSVLSSYYEPLSKIPPGKERLIIIIGELLKYTLYRSHTCSNSPFCSSFTSRCRWGQCLEGLGFGKRHWFHIFRWISQAYLRIQRTGTHSFCHRRLYYGLVAELK